MLNAPYDYAEQEDISPLDSVEELATSKGWKFTRNDDDFLTIALPTQKGACDTWLEWQDEFSALLISCSIPVEISDDHYESAAQTIEQINQNLWLGHFDLSNKNKFPTFRHTLLMRMVPAGVGIDTIHDVLDIAIAECNRFHTTFQLVQAGDVALQDSLTAAIFETVGEA